MAKFKAQFHVHTGQDPLDWVTYTEKEAIDHAARCGYEIMAITCHNVIIFNEDLKKYAATRRILLIPGIEKKICGKHILIINADISAQQLKNFDDLRAYRKRKKDIFVIAAHPYYPDSTCLRKKLENNIDLFDAIEYSWFHSKKINMYNKKAVQTADKHSLPVIYTSDCHILKYLDTTFSYIDSEKKDIESIFKALKNKKITSYSQNLKIRQLIAIYITLFFKNLIKFFVPR